jgi:hypothetical protein
MMRRLANWSTTRSRKLGSGFPAIGRQLKSGNAERKRPSAKIAAPRRRTFRTSSRSLAPRARRAFSERCVVMPTMKRKKGKIRSVGVHPCHGACSSGA